MIDFWSGFSRCQWLSCSLFAPTAHSSPENLLTCHLIYHLSPRILLVHSGSRIYHHWLRSDRKLPRECGIRLLHCFAGDGVQRPVSPFTVVTLSHHLFFKRAPGYARRPGMLPSIYSTTGEISRLFS